MNGSNLISVRGGVIFKINLQNQTAVVLRTSTSDRISINHRRVDLQLSGKGMVIFDPGNMPVLMEGNNVKRSVWTTVEENGAITKGVPQSNMGVFVQSRLWVDISGTDFTAGDFVGDVNNPDANFTFDEVFTEGAPYVDQIFNLGYGFGNYRITAMGFVASRNGNSRLQVSQYGSLYVATRNSVHIYSAELPRAQWATTDFGRLELYGTGIVGQRAHSIIGSDILFQDINGYVHSLSKNQSDARQGWVTTRISREVEDWLKPVSKSYLDVGFITPYNTRIYVGAKPIRVKTPNYLGGVSYDFCHEGMVVLELDNASSMSGAAAPAWAGMWTGIRPMEATEIDGALYITSRDIDGFARTYRVREDVSFDTWNGYSRSVKGRIYMRSYDHEQPFMDKLEHSVDMSVSDIRDSLVLKVYRKPLNMNNWARWGRYAYKKDCKVVCENSSLLPVAPFGLSSLSFGEPDEASCNEVTSTSASYYRENQLMVEFEGGQWTINRVKLKAEIFPESDGATPYTEMKVINVPRFDCDRVHDLDLCSVTPRVGDDIGESYDECD